MRKIALVHDWLTTYAGSERVLEQILLLYPEADLYSLVDFLPSEQRGFLQGKPVHTTFLQHFPFARRRFRQYLGLMPLAIESLDLSGYDLVITSSHAVAKGVLTSPDQLHISYVHSPIRYAWDMQSAYLGADRSMVGLKRWLALLLLHYMRLWDTRTANSVDCLVANSRYVAGRIHKFYRREAVVIHPPVDVTSFPLCEQKSDYYLVVSRLVQYKYVARIVEAFAGLPDRRLVVIGDGPEQKSLARSASSNVQFLGYQPTGVVSRYMQQAKAFVFAAKEDFGIVLLEAQACGTPVIAYGRGGACETIYGQRSTCPTGFFFYDQTAQGIQAAVQDFEQAKLDISPTACRENALRFSPECFRQQFSQLVEQNWERFG